MATHAARAARIGKTALVACLSAAALIASGCGSSQQSAGLSGGTWKVAVDKWEFPKRQPLGTPVTMKLVIRNADTKPIPALTVAIGGLTMTVDQQGAQSRTRPVWILNDERHGDQTSDNSLDKRTFRLGALAAGATRTFTLPVTPLRRGEHVVSYTITPDLYGVGKAETPGGGAAAGVRTIAIDPTPNFDESVFK